MGVVGVAAFALARSEGLRDRWQTETLGLITAGNRMTHLEAPECRPGQPEGYRGAGACLIGEVSARPDFVVWGDSHAGALTPGFRTMAAAQGAAGVVIRKNACPPLLGIDRDDMPVWHRCSAHNADVLAYLEAARPSTVYLVGRWALVASGGVPYGDEPHTRARFAAHAVPDNAADLFPAVLHRTVEALSRTGAKVVIVDSVPEVGWDVPSVLARAAEWGIDARPGPSAAAFDRRQAKVRAGFTGLDVRVLRPSDVLCNASECRVSIDGTPLYSDDDHLSPYGASLMAPLLGAELRMAAARGPAS